MGSWSDSNSYPAHKWDLRSCTLLMGSWARKSGVGGEQCRKQLPATHKHMTALKPASSSAHYPHYSAVKGRASDLWCENYILTRCHMCLKSLFITILPHLLPKTQTHLISIRTDASPYLHCETASGRKNTKQPKHSDWIKYLQSHVKRASHNTWQNAEDKSLTCTLWGS